MTDTVPYRIAAAALFAVVLTTTVIHIQTNGRYNRAILAVNIMAILTLAAWLVWMHQ